ncbi:tripartite tricarboxylate transporter permease [Spiribacter halobius]|uniref:DUF112 domain-containing protein n=1 Tax=Sediminicurvatus halobius TaxID=2182432 RepID=A0A2U2MX94_9GAMM|nr:tripartite tricarboxylate transporter permease [Spiribacter halobius]PWG61480.1 hypothetical protein DEM34_16085 [Spiribacter halobius]UEX77982.1 tripartite tricarboxylate transporter permease [Spiribacter halobius]
MWNDLLGGAAALLTDPMGLLAFAAGLFGGMIFGVIPGISLLTLGAIILPFTAYLSAEHAIMLFSVIYCSGVFGGAITAILFNIPGSPENAPTAFDGYPMTQNGESGKAVGATVLCSALGGIASAILMITATPAIARWAVSAFSAQEIFALIVFGVSVAASVGAQTVLKGWISVALGLLLATVGTDPAGGVERFAFDTYYLLAGIHFIPVILGLFAVSEVLEQARQMVNRERVVPKVSMDLPSIREFWRLKVAIVRSVGIGFFSGILPGVGATLAAFLSYNEAVRWSKGDKRFGKGDIRGVVSSETANNAATGAAMIPLLALGLPGGALTAMMMGVFQIHGMEPGPMIFVMSPDLVSITFAAMLIANVCILALGWIQTKSVVHLLRVPFQYLAPAVLLLAIIGAFAVRNLIVDVWIMFAAAFIGFFLRKYGYSAAGMILGLVLGSIGEASLVKSMQLMQYNWLGFFERPYSALLLGAAIVTVVTGVIRATRREIRARC